MKIIKEEDQHGYEKEEEEVIEKKKKKKQFYSIKFYSYLDVLKLLYCACCAYVFALALVLAQTRVHVQVRGQIYVFCLYVCHLIPHHFHWMAKAFHFVAVVVQLLPAATVEPY